MQLSTRPRLKYFDMLKGVAIFLVVMGHVITFCIRGLDYGFLFKFVSAVHMPIFFFISGWFIYKISSDEKIVFPKIKDRAIQLLVPTIVVGALWVLYFPHSYIETPLDSTFSGIINNEMKNGYWFTIALFEFVLIYAALVPIFRKIKNIFIWTLFHIIFYYLLIHIVVLAIPNNVINILGLYEFCSYYCAFFFGVTARKYKDTFMHAISNSWIQTAAILLFAISFYLYTWYWEFPALTLSRLFIITSVMHICLITFVIPVFMKWDAYANATESSSLAKKVAGFWEYLGTQSLGIYLLHYFLLFPFNNGVRECLNSTHCGLVPSAVFAAFWALAIIGVTLIIIKLIEPSKQLTLLLTGKREPKQ